MIKMIYEYGDLQIVKYSKPDTKSDLPFYVFSILDINIKVPADDIEKMVRAISSDITLSLLLEFGKEYNKKPGETGVIHP